MGKRRMRWHVVLLGGILLMLGAGCSLVRDPDPDFDYGARIRPYALCPDSPPSEDLSEECVEAVGEAFDTAKAAGMTTIDFELGWPWTSLAGRRGADHRRSYDWRYTDLMVEEAEERGMEATLMLGSTPDWVHPYLADADGPRYVPDADERIWHPPRGDVELAHWSNFVKDVVGRYEGRVSHYEIWNEPNHPPFWRPDTGSPPEAAEYAALLRTSYLAAKEVYPEAAIVSGGLSGNDLGYLRSYYEAAKAYPDAEENDYYFDVLGVHPYSLDRPPDLWNAADWNRYANVAVPEGCENRAELRSCHAVYFTGFDRLKTLMDEQGDTGKEMFFSEYGVPTAASLGTPGVGEERQALFLKRAYAKAREYDYVTGLNWYAFHSHGHDPSPWAIVDDGFESSMAYRALQEVTDSEASDAKITISLDDNVSDIQTISPRLANLSKSDVANWELWVLGDDPASSGSTPQKEQAAAPVNWDTTSMGDGNYWVMVAAYTTEGSVWASNWELVEVDNTRFEG